MNTDSIENSYASFHIKEGVMYFTYKNGAVIDLEAARLVVQDRLKLQSGQNFPVICDIRGMKSIDKSARDFLAKEGSEKVEAVALIVASPATKFLSNFYLSVNQPDVPTKLFNNEQEAMEYIRSLKNK